MNAVIKKKGAGRPITRDLPTNDYTMALETARNILGSYGVIGELCGGLSEAAVRKWKYTGRPPFTEYNGVTNYAKIISDATNGEVSEAVLTPRLVRPEVVYER